MGRKKQAAKIQRSGVTVRLKEVVPQDFREILSMILQLCKETDSRTRVLFSKIHNLQVESNELQIAVKGLCQTLLELIEVPENLHHAEAIVRDWLIKLHAKK